MDTEETIKFLNDILTAEIEPHAEDTDLKERFLERVGLDEEGVRHEARQFAAIALIAGRLMGDEPLDIVEAVCLQGFHLGYLAAEVQAMNHGFPTSEQ